MVTNSKGERPQEPKGKEEGVNINYDSRGADRYDNRYYMNEYRPTLEAGLKGKLRYPPEARPAGKQWMWFSINPNLERDYYEEALEKGWTAVKRSANPYFNTSSNHMDIYRKNQDKGDVVIKYQNILMEIDMELYQMMEKFYISKAHERANSTGKKVNYVNPGLFDKAEGKVKRYSHEHRPFQPGDL